MKPIHYFLLGLLLLAGCNGRQDTQRPESVALTFFDALYNQKDAQSAMALVNEPLRDVMSHYRIASQIQRNVLGLALDEAELSVGEVDIDFFRRNAQQVEVLIQLSGHNGHRRINDDRLVRLEKEGERWVITHLYSDPFQTNG
ncbi:hypothetical protein [Ferrimonas balearica]|uniref:hypothetical protein n=1 Tax=Ferrimonas balearica TaxID=44012 RepID=UPI001C992EB6|nr:hypothetical protein [Ferrimonas balearica]MBY5922179.1 hypothetical protein [Ferrimonas balearica]MBY5994481.1 hypothetical protein [Ferrimonas balearica]